MKLNKVLTLTLLILSLVLVSTGVAAAISPTDAAVKALDWLKTQQNDDGGFGSGFGPGSAVGPSADAVLAITSSGRDVTAWATGGASPLDYLRAQASAGKLTLPGEIAKTILALVSAGQNPRDFGGHDLISDLQSQLDTSTGLFSFSTYDQALAILAMSNAGEPIPGAAVTALLGAQTVEGGWAFTGETIAGAADSNTTALAVQALVAVGGKDDTGRALDYFRRVQNPDAGWTYQVPSPFGTDTDANSTALGAQALLAAGESLSNWAVSGSDPIGALLALQNDDGSFSFNAVFSGPNALATIQAIPALYGQTFVRVRVVPASAAPAVVLLPEAGASLNAPGAALLSAALLSAALGLALMAAGFLMRRRVRVS